MANIRPAIALQRIFDGSRVIEEGQTFDFDFDQPYNEHAIVEAEEVVVSESRPKASKKKSEDIL
jgi:hypothetical protein